MTDLSKGILLVTGGAGFIGSALIAELNRRGLTNIVIADFLGHDEKWKNLVPLRFSDYLEATVLRERLTSRPQWLGEVAAIFHLGACSSTTETDAAYLISNNYEYTKCLAHAALEGGSRFVYASSAATYGSDANHRNESEPLERLRPLNMYGYSKHLFDCYAATAGILPLITGLKYFNIFGPNENHKGEMRSLVSKAFDQIQMTGRISLFKSYRPEFSDGEQCRDFMYVKDAVSATLFLAEYANGGGLFNIGSGFARTWVALAKAIFCALGKEPMIEFIEMPEQIRAKYQYFTSADIRKLRHAGFSSPISSLEDAVHDYVSRYLIPQRHLGDEVFADALMPVLPAH